MERNGERLMKSIFGFMRNHKAATMAVIGIVVLLLLGGPLMINVLFKHSAPVEILRAEWDAKDALSYYGSALSFLSTLILSGLAIWQNRRIQEENLKYTEQLEKMERAKFAPKLNIEQVVLTGGSGGTLQFVIKNESENHAYDVRLSDIHIEDARGERVGDSFEEQEVEYISQNKPYTAVLRKFPVADDGCSLYITVTYKDILNYEHMEKVYGSIGKHGVTSFKISPSYF